MITIEIPRSDEDEKIINLEKVSPPMLKAVRETLQAYPTVTNETDNKDFDRLFENLYNCSIEYADDGVASRVSWSKDRDYTVFLLRWS